MRKIFFLTFVLSTVVAQAQLAKLTVADEQVYRNNAKGSVVIVTPFSKSILSVHGSDIVSDGKDGYVRKEIQKMNVGSTKAGAYVHLFKLDRRLTIKSDNEIFLQAEGSENLEPVGSFAAGGFLHVLLAGPDKSDNAFKLTYWQFDLATLALTKSNETIATLPFDKSKAYSFTTLFGNNGRFGLTVLEEGGKKEPAVLHCLSFNEDRSLVFKQTTTLPFAGKRGRIDRTLINGAGNIFALLGFPNEKNSDFTDYNLLVVNKEKATALPLQHNGQPLVNCMLGLSAGNDIMLGGLIWPGKKDYLTGLVIGKITDAGTLTVIKEESFAKSMLDVLEKTNKTGLNKDYYISSVTERANGVVDVVLQYCFQNDGWGAGGNNAYIEILDAVVFSFDKGQLVSTLPIKRVLRQTSNGGVYNVVSQARFGMSQVFTQNDNLYLMYFDNPDNTIGANDDKQPKWSNFYKGVLTLARIDKNYKATQQQLVEFGGDSGFRSFFDLHVDKLADKKYILTADKYGIFTRNVKTSSILVDVN